MSADTVEAVVKIGGLVLTALALIGGGIKFLLLNRSGGADLVAELRKQLDAQEKRIGDLERELDERDERHRDEVDGLLRAHRDEMADLRREHRDEIDKLQREVRDLYDRARPRPGTG